MYLETKFKAAPQAEAKSWKKLPVWKRGHVLEKQVSKGSRYIERRMSMALGDQKARRNEPLGQEQWDKGYGMGGTLLLGSGLCFC